MENFNEIGLPESLLHTLQSMQFITPTPIQAKAIPLALEGRDIMGSAQTGTGKTGAFGIPLVAHILSNTESTALVMTPTRELASQVLQQIRQMLGKKSKIKSALLIGGDPMPKQLNQLRNRARIIVGTPGRINDHIKRKSLNLTNANFLVLDETDRMLDMGFTIQIEEVLKHMPEQKQTLLFSATLPQNIIQIATKYLNNPEHIAIGETSAPAPRIKQENLRIKESDKYEKLISQLDKRYGSIIIFIKTKHATEKMAKRLSEGGYKADAIHGDLRQTKRERVIANFRNKKYRILVATDVAARGLDIPHIEHVINYDLPQCAEDYIHRIGRTARAGAEGEALNFITPSDKEKWNAISRILDPNSKPLDPQRPQRKRKFGDKKFKDRKFGEKKFGDRKFGANKRSTNSRVKRDPKQAFQRKKAR